MIKDFRALRIKLASPVEILSWSHGEVTKAETINYRTFRPEVDGLMDERIFGPSKDFECFCGKYKKIRYKGIVCDRCGVEVTSKRVRRERMGHIKLVSPVTHVWFAHGIPNRLSLILDIPQKKLETVIYYARYLVTSVDDDGKQKALESLKTLQEEELKNLEQELADKLKEVEDDVEDKVAQLRKEEKEADKLGVQVERLRAKERKDNAHIKSAFNQRRENIENKFESMESLIGTMTVGSTISEEEKGQLDNYAMFFFEADMGAPAIKMLLQSLDLGKEISMLEEEIATTKSEAKKNRAIQRKRLLSGMHKAELQADWIILDVLPVLPPDLRPIIQLPGGRFATSDLNDLYRRVINRNNRLKRLIELGAPQVILRNERRMLQEAVDALLDNNHRPGAATTNSRGMPYKSLSDQLRGKQGRFRQNLLGKRVDYSGRAVIVPGAELKYYQCGLPKNIALELFKPFIIRELIGRGLATNPARARFIYEEKTKDVWDILEEVSKDRPVLLNRAPTLHKQGIVAFFPVLIEGNAIQLHPMMCKGYNADFDGDQMAVHLPLSREAVEEAKDRMMAPNVMLSMGSGKPIMITDKDMATGIYFLTLMEGQPEDAKRAFTSVEEVISQKDLGTISLYEPIKLLMNGELLTTTAGRVIFNQVVPEGYGFINRTLNRKAVEVISGDIFAKFGRQVAIEFLDSVKTLGFNYCEKAGFSVSMQDFEFGADAMAKDYLQKFAAEEDRMLNDYYEGLTTKEELARLQSEEWQRTYETIHEKTWEIAKGTSHNLLHLNESGATPVASWVKQISGVRGSVTDPSGNLVPLPLTNNFKNGLNNFEYFVAARGTRKGFADVALRTADSGYLTRRLVDVAQDVIVNDHDCGTTAGIYLNRGDKRNQSFADRLRGRFLAEDVADPATGEVLGKTGEEITIDMSRAIAANESILKVKLRSPLTCNHSHGICQKCYGYDFGTGQMVEIGEAVGIIAAQSIGEPTTQLTLKNKSDARAKGDVTQGLPRVEELFEIRTPKVKALIADLSGNVKIVENESDVTIRISAMKKLRKTFEIEEGDEVLVSRAKKVKAGDELMTKKDGTKVTAEFEGKIEIADGKLYLLIDKEVESEMVTESLSDLMVKDGEYVEVGQRLTYGSIDPKELVMFTEIYDAQKYIIDEVQSVYSVYGIEVDDRHFELILSQMARFGKITNIGDSDYLLGESADVRELDQLSTKLKSEGKRGVQYERVLLGLTNTALGTESFLSAASFEQQVRVLTDAALVGKVDHLRGLKENVIIGRLVPLGNVLKQSMSDAEEASNPEAEQLAA